MLGKLLKYEFKASGRRLLPLYGAVLLLALINKLFLGDFFINENTNLGNIPRVIGMMVYVTTLIGTFIATLFIIIQRYRKNLLSDEGYLMNTIPVKPWQNIISKLIVACLWSVLSFIVAMVSIFVLAYEKGLFVRIITGIPQFINSMLTVIDTYAVIFAVEVILIMIINGIKGILMIYASISIGSLFSKRKILASFGAFIAFNIISNTVGAFIQVPMIFFIGNDSYPQSGSLHMLLIVALGLYSVFTVIYFVISNYILSRKLNLE